MNINEVGPFLRALADPTVRSKHFSIDSLTSIAYLKKKVSLAADEYSNLVETLAVKVKKSDDQMSYIPIDATPESAQAYKEFVKANADLRQKDIEGLTLNFVTKEELKKVVEETSLEIATTLIIHLVKE